jgi:hypothetical protein
LEYSKSGKMIGICLMEQLVYTEQVASNSSTFGFYLGDAFFIFQLGHAFLTLHGFCVM